MGRKLQSIRGVHDGLPADTARWQHIEQTACRLFARYGLREVRLPVLEPVDLFVRSIGRETDIVSKEMYRFTDQGGDDLCLRPEGTAGAVRAWLQAGLTRSGVQRWYYAGPMFRRERPQKGRLRQFQQLGVEMFGVPGPVEDVEVLTMAWALISALDISDVHMEINSLGCPACRPAYREVLVAFLHACSGRLCDTCRTRIEANPMRVLDCKVASCQAELARAPDMLSHLCQDCSAHFSGVRQGLDALQTPYHVNPRIVRGLDYYTRTSFEIITRRLGAQGTVIAGGRYDGLIEELGGPATPAIGFALGLERLAMLLPESDPAGPDVAVVGLGAAAQTHALKLAQDMRTAGLSVVHCGTGSAKALFRRADREGARFVAVIGDDEMGKGVIGLKNMRDGSQRQMTAVEAIAECQAPLPAL